MCNKNMYVEKVAYSLTRTRKFCLSSDNNTHDENGIFKKKENEKNLKSINETMPETTMIN